MRPVIVRIGNLVIEGGALGEPHGAFPGTPARRSWGSGGWARPGAAGRLPDPWQRAAERPRHRTDPGEARRG
ncbi:hypothetical protein NE235_00150 [Actinoallomurus spadix]|uniref:Dihydroorotase n=1 Tax=Actinoallomurus spadix TaxID=79912 RepID=A0ABP3GB24_9ACTN|nr:hypothetical protein [Actinoallomurus spadix]MCO5984509.1 hypothetical protein [Actinoallomurus spadix]